MYLFDTSSLIYAWDTYPQNAVMFRPFWTWFEEQLKTNGFVVSDTSRSELKGRSKELKSWLDSLGFEYLPTSEHILTCAAEIKMHWIGEEEYGAGVGKNDLLNIGAAKVCNCTLIADEKQPGLPHNKRNYKIPTLCSMPYVGISCLTFVELINEMNQ